MKRRRNRYNIRLARKINPRAWALVVKRKVGTPRRSIAGAGRLPRSEAVLLAVLFGGGFGNRGPNGKMVPLRLRLWHLHLAKSSTRCVSRRLRGYRGQPPAMGGAYRSPFAWKRISTFQGGGR